MSLNPIKHFLILFFVLLAFSGCGGSAGGNQVQGSATLTVTNGMAQDFSSAYVYLDTSAQTLYSGGFKCKKGETCALAIAQTQSGETFYALFYNNDGDLVGAWHSGGPLINGMQATASPFGLGYYLTMEYVSSTRANYGATLVNAIQILAAGGTAADVFNQFSVTANSITEGSGKQPVSQIDSRTIQLYSVNNSTITPIVGLNPYAGGNCGANRDNWMGCYQSDLANNRLADTFIPGTHDSGTAAIPDIPFVPTQKAITQQKTIGGQLNDGIRYFDLRIRERAHTGCADSGAWEIYHGSATYSSYRLIEVLSDIKNFLTANGHQRELIILDFQDVNTDTSASHHDADGFNEPASRGNALNTIQTWLGPWMINSSDANYKWMGPKASSDTKTLGAMWAQNDLVGGIAKQVLVLTPWSASHTQTTTAETCGQFTDALFNDRGVVIGSNTYGQRETADAIAWDIRASLFANQPVHPNGFADYRAGQAAGKLNILQIVPRPSDTWYFAADLTFCGWGSLLEYADHCVNNSFVSAGWLWNEELVGATAANKADPSSANTSNIIIIDNYSSGNVVWPMGTYVDTIIAKQTWAK